MGHGDWKDMFRGVQNGDFELVKYYIRMGVDLNYQHPEFLTSPLIEAIRNHNLAMVTLLLENGALPDISEADSEKSPMTIAKEIANREIVYKLNEYLKTNEEVSDLHSQAKLKFAFTKMWKTCINFLKI